MSLSKIAPWALALALHAGKNATSPFAPTVFNSAVGRSVSARRGGSFMGVAG